MGVKSNGDIFYVNNYLDKDVNQSELEWSVVSQGDNKISLMSNNQTFLNSTPNGIIKTDATEMTINTIWKTKNVDDNILLESSVKKNQFVTYLPNDDVCTVLKNGIIDEQYWTIYPLEESDEDNPIKAFDGFDYRNKMILLFEAYVQSKKLSKIIGNEIQILRQLNDKINNIFNNVKQSLNNTYMNSSNQMSELTANYLTELGEVDEYRRRLSNSNLSPDLFSSYSSEIERIETKLKIRGKTMLTMENKLKIENQLKIQKEYYKNIINKKIISLNKELVKTQLTKNTDMELDKFIMDLKDEINSLESQLNNNNVLLARQSNKIKTLKNNNYTKIKRIDNIKQNEEIYNFNHLKQQKILNEHNTMINYYIASITVLSIFIIVMIYINYRRFVTL